MKDIYTKFFSLLLLCLITPFFAGAFQFKNDLRVGSLNADVIELQKILNLDSYTVVSNSTFGSKGNETNYFGNLTKQAVIRFQEKYRNEILTPSGLSSGTGFVGPSTRKKLNDISKSSPSILFTPSVIPVQTGIQSGKMNGLTEGGIKNNSVNMSSFGDINPSDIGVANTYFGSTLGKIFGQSGTSLDSASLDKEILNSIPFFTKILKVYSAQPYQVKPGQKVSIEGVGFTENNNLFSFGGVKTEGIKCSYSTYCEVFIPNNVPFGEQTVLLQNSNGNTSTQGFSVKIFVTNDPKSAPTIISANPNEINETNLSLSIVTKGENFTATENYIDTPLGEIGPFNSTDEKTLVFSIEKMTDIDKLISRGKQMKLSEIPLPFMVTNQNGSSEAFFINLILN